jgi:hypothetical protein
VGGQGVREGGGGLGGDGARARERERDLPITRSQEDNNIISNNACKYLSLEIRGGWAQMIPRDLM